MSGRHRPHPRIRLDDLDRALVTRQIIAAHARRHPNVVLKNCTPVACDKDSKQLLYEFDSALAELNSVPTRRARKPARLTPSTL